MYAETGLFDPNKPISEYTSEEYDRLLYGKAERINIPSAGDMNVTYEGIVTRFMRTNVHTEKETTKKQQRFWRRIPKWTLVQNAKENVSHTKS